MPVKPGEVRARQQRFCAQLKAAGFCGAVVVSRAGGTFDRYGDIFYLTGHYQPYVYLPERPPRWSGRSHAVLIANAQGDIVLHCSIPGDNGVTEPVADHLVYGDYFWKSVGDGAMGLGLTDGDVALIGGDVLPAATLPDVLGGFERNRVRAADELLATLRRIKSAAERELVRNAARVGRNAVDAFLDALHPGVRESDAAAQAAHVVVSEGGAIYLMAVSSGPNTWSYTPKPLPGYGTRRLEEGDLVRLDLVAVVDGYMTDFGRTAVVGAASDAQARLLEALHAGLDAAIAAVAPGIRVNGVVAAGDDALREHGVAVGGERRGASLVAGYPPHWGHGFGLGWERPWLTDDEDLTIEPGMCLAIERSVTLEQVGTASAEQNLLVTEEGAEILTGGARGRWS